MEILFEDGDLVVVNKPAGLSSEGDGVPARLAARFAEAGEHTAAPFLVHRLDRPTSGLMVVCKNQAAAAALSRTITEGRMEKTYLCVAEGVPTPADGEMTDFLFFDRQKDKSFPVKKGKGGAKEARLLYTVRDTRVPTFEEKVACAAGKTPPAALSLVSVRLLTGRTHQIRAQFAARRLPLVGDARYGAALRGLPLALCSASLVFPHPRTGAPLSFSLSLPRGGAFAGFTDG